MYVGWVSEVRGSLTFCTLLISLRYPPPANATPRPARTKTGRPRHAEFWRPDPSSKPYAFCGARVDEPAGRAPLPRLVLLWVRGIEPLYYTTSGQVTFELREGCDLLMNRDSG